MRGLALTVLLSAAVISAAGSRPAETCATAERHEFDFILGNWLVRDSAGKAVGTATFARAYAGCVLLESRLGAAGAGQSLGVIGFEAESGAWQRDFLDPAGVVLTLRGGMDGSAMVMSCREYRPEGVWIHRLTWQPGSDGTVEELWQTSSDEGREWQERFRGVFHRIAE